MSRVSRQRDLVPGQREPAWMQAVPACPGCPGEKSIGLSFFPDVRPGLRPLCSGFMCFDARCNQSVHALSLIVPLQAAFVEMLRKP